MNTQPVSGAQRLSSSLCSLSGDRRRGGLTLTVQGGSRPPVRTANVAARRLTKRPANEAAQLAYSEWLLTKLSA